MKALADALLSDLARRLEGRAAPRVKDLHLPPLPWNGRKDGEFCALELEDGSMGLSYVRLDDHLQSLAASNATKDLRGADAMRVAARWRDGQGAERTLGFAAVNALSRHLLDLEGFVPPDAADSIAALDPQPGEHIGMVGLFPPLLAQVTACGARLTVLERRSELAGVRADCTVTLDPRRLAVCDKILCTSTVLLNHTLDDVLAHSRQARRFALVGPGAGCLPATLFEAGVSTLAGTWIADGPALVQFLRTGRPWSASTRKFTLHAPPRRHPPRG